MTALPQIPVALYRLFNADGDLLYLGITSTPAARMTAHSNEKPWWGEVDLDRTRFEWLSNRTEAERAEVEAIRAELPRYNVADHPGNRDAMVARARAVALASMAARAGSGVPLADVDNIERITDPAERARQAGERLAAVPAWQERLRKIRQAAVLELRERNMSYAEIGKELGLHRNRIQQIAEGRPGGGKGAKAAQEADA